MSATSTSVTGRQAKDDAPKNFLYRGIAGRPFERRFELAEYIQVSGASLENGLLHIDLVRQVPEAKKPRTVKINGEPLTCGQLPLPAEIDGDYYFDISAGQFEYASFFWF